MRPYIYILILFACHSLHAQQTLNLLTGSLYNKQFETTPTREVKITDNGIYVTYTFHYASITTDPLFNEAKMWTIDGLGVNHIPEEPAILSRSDLFALPNGTTATLKLGDCEYKDFACNLSPARHLLPAEGFEDNTQKNVLPIKPYEDMFPKEIATLDCHQFYRGVPLQRVNISPLQYNYEHQTVRVYTKLQYILSFDHSTTQSAHSNIEPEHPYISPTDYFLNNLTINGNTNSETRSQMFQTYYIEEKAYLILTTSTYIEAAKKFATWKTQQGFKVQIIAANNWDSNKVKGRVRSFYANNPQLYYLLILGSNSDVPADTAIGKTVNNHFIGLTDYYYGCTTDDKEAIPEILCGRIPISSAEEANTVIEKIINHEKFPSTSDSFYNTGLHCTYFEENPSNPVEENTSFVYVTEKAKAHMEQQNKNAQRLYAAKSSVTPLMWSNSWTKGGSIPEELRRPVFSWDANASSFIQSVNNGAFYAFYYGHGNEYGWEGLDFTSANIQKLNNFSKLPVIFSISCSTGNIGFKSPCFAQNLLSYKHGGCAAIIAAMGKSIQGLNDGLLYGILGAIWPNPLISEIIIRPEVGSYQNYYSAPTPIYTIGGILRYAQLRCRETWGTLPDSRNLSFQHYNREIYQCFGDPSMELFTEKPTAFNNINIQLSEKINVTVSDTTDSPIKISIYDTSTNKSKCFVGNNAYYYTENPYDIDIYITSHNKIPYIFRGTTYIQNETISYKNGKVESPRIVIGENVTTSIPIGEAHFSSGPIYLQSEIVEFHPGSKISSTSELHIEF